MVNRIFTGKFTST